MLGKKQQRTSCFPIAKLKNKRSFKRAKTASQKHPCIFVKAVSHTTPFQSMILCNSWDGLKVHRIIKWIRLEGTLKIPQLQPLHYGQGWHPLNQVAHLSIQPGLECFHPGMEQPRPCATSYRTIEMLRILITTAAKHFGRYQNCILEDIKAHLAKKIRRDIVFIQIIPCLPK